MQVPYANEVREARRLAEEATRAAEDLGVVNATLVMVGVFQRQLARHPDSEVEVPGDELVERLAERWDMLRDLPSAGHTSDLDEALRSRRSQLLLARQVLNPLAEQAEARGHAMHELQHRQVDALREPRYADLMSQLTEWSQDRNGAMQTCRHLDEQRIRMEPAFELLNSAHREVMEAAQYIPDATEDLDAWLRARHALRMVDTLLGVVGDLEMGTYITAVPTLPELPDGRPGAALLRTLHGLEETLGALRQQLSNDMAKVQTGAREARERHDELTRRIIDLAG